MDRRNSQTNEEAIQLLIVELLAVRPADPLPDRLPRMQIAPLVPCPYGIDVIGVVMDYARSSFGVVQLYPAVNGV